MEKVIGYYKVSVNSDCVTSVASVRDKLEDCFRIYNEEMKKAGYQGCIYNITKNSVIVLMLMESNNTPVKQLYQNGECQIRNFFSHYTRGVLGKGVTICIRSHSIVDGDSYTKKFKNLAGISSTANTIDVESTSTNNPTLLSNHLSKIMIDRTQLAYISELAKKRNVTEEEVLYQIIYKYAVSQR